MMMDEPETPRPLRDRALGEAAREDLEFYSVGDLEARIDMLEAEIGRSRAAIDKKRHSRTAADAFFSLSGS